MYVCVGGGGSVEVWGCVGVAYLSIFVDYK